jgi:hypothetical protein
MKLKTFNEFLKENLKELEIEFKQGIISLEEIEFLAHTDMDIQYLETDRYPIGYKPRY